MAIQHNTQINFGPVIGVMLAILAWVPTYYLGRAIFQALGQMFR
jgi:hypothetical protein